MFNILTFQPWFNHINIVFTKMLPTFYELGIGIIIGVQVIDIVDKKTISIILGIIVLSATLHEIKFSNFEINSKYEKIIGIFASLIGGVTGGISTIWAHIQIKPGNFRRVRIEQTWPNPWLISFFTCWNRNPRWSGGLELFLMNT